jgi:hypothetical protein
MVAEIIWRTMAHPMQVRCDHAPPSWAPHHPVAIRATSATYQFFCTLITHGVWLLAFFFDWV